MPLRSAKTWRNRIATTLSNNRHEKTKETSKYKKLLISKRRIGILKKVPKQGEDSDFIIFEILLKSYT